MTLAICFVLFIVEYFWLYKLIKNAILCIITSILLNILTFIAIFEFSIKKFKLKKISFQDQKLAKKCFNELIFMKSKSLVTFLENLLSSKHISNNLYENDEATFYVNLISPCNERDFHEAYNYILSNNKPLYFICSKATEEFQNLVANSPIKLEVFSEVDLFILMKEKNLYPFQLEPQPSPRQNVLNLKNKFKNSITKSHFKEFFFSGLSLIVISIVIPFSIYYLVCGTLLLLLSVACLFFKNNTTVKKSKNSLSAIVKDATNK